jgi:hypothetical protein
MDRPITQKRLSFDTLKFLNFVKDPSETHYIFVKGQEGEGNLLGYYDPTHRSEVVNDIAPLDGKAKGIYWAINRIAPDSCPPLSNSISAATHTTAIRTKFISRRHILLVDIDCIRPKDCSSTDEEKDGAYLLARLIYRDLGKAGWPKPVVVDSGNGYQLLYRIDLPVEDDGLVRKCLRALAEQYDQGNLKIDTVVHDNNRVAKLPGTMACKGKSSEERPHRRSGFFNLPDRFDVVPRELLDKLAGSWQPTQPQPSSKPLQHSITSSPDLVARARAYLTAMPPAISGQNGRNQFLNAACRMVDDFALCREQAMTLLAEYNTRCEPPFSGREVADKLDSALTKVAARGGPSRSKAGLAIAESPSSGPRFVGYVPDFTLVALSYFYCSRDLPVALGEIIFRFSLWNRLHDAPLIPDILMRQLVWGARHDKNWRARLAKKKNILGRLKPVKNNKVCSVERCMLHGTGVAHRHYADNWQKYPILESFRAKNDFCHIHSQRFLLFSDEFKELREQLQRKGQLLNGYCPAFVLGGSPKVGWTWSQQVLVFGMVRELTRTKSKPGTGITGEIVKGGMVAATSNGSRLVPCPLLDQATEYVAFAGNGKRKGRGYQIIGRTDKGWLHRSGYKLPVRHPSGDSDKKRRELMKPFLTDLEFLSRELGLVPAGVLNGKWKSMGQMMDCLRTGNGQDWLEECTLRIYAPADWRTRWRRYFSDKLGFDWIPETPEDYGRSESSEVPNSLGSSYAIRAWLEKVDWSQRQLAEQISVVTGRHCSVRRVERNLSSRGPSGDFQRDVATIQGKLHASDT